MAKRKHPILATTVPAMGAGLLTPHLSNWGQALILGPGSITVAHTEREFVSKSDLVEAVANYVALAEYLTNVSATGGQVGYI